MRAASLSEMVKPARAGKTQARAPVRLSGVDLTAVPSDKAMAHHKDEMRKLVGPKQCYVPISELVDEVNQKLRGWGEYFSYGHPRRAHRKINTFVIGRLTKHLGRRSQRACRPPAGMTYYGFLTRRLGLKLL
jgi:RNA-directed DNA polymerase